MDGKVLIVWTAIRHCESRHCAGARDPTGVRAAEASAAAGAGLAAALAVGFGPGFGGPALPGGRGPAWPFGVLAGGSGVFPR